MSLFAAIADLLPDPNYGVINLSVVIFVILFSINYAI